MFSFFTDPYPDETLFSIAMRYYYYTGNTNWRDTSNELFGRFKSVSQIELTDGLEYLSNKFSPQSKYSSEYFINNHTIFPLFEPFWNRDKMENVKSGMKYHDKNIINRTGLFTSNIRRKGGAWYCPLCANEDVEKYGEAYFHRLHQIPGIFICPIHICILKQYPITLNSKGMRYFSRLDIDKVNPQAEYIGDLDLENKLKRIALSVQYLLENNLSDHNVELVYNKYLSILNEFGLVRTNGSIKYEELNEKFTTYHGEKLLMMLESNLKTKNNWLRRYIRINPPVNTLHPIRHILLILFLCNNVKDFFHINLKEKKLIADIIGNKVQNKLPFGEGPWPCLNNAADHYKQLVVNSCKLSQSSTENPKGTFMCDCGFVYLRKGPDTYIEDIYRYDYIVKYGESFDERLKEVLLSNKNIYSSTELAKIMKCNHKTIINHAARIGLLGYINTKAQPEGGNQIKVKGIFATKDYIKECRKNIADYIKNNPGCTRNQIDREIGAIFRPLYKWDRKWLDEIIPPSHANKRNNINYSDRVDWVKRDIELLEKIKDAYEYFINLDDPLRITKALIGNYLGIKTTLYQSLEKLPKTKIYINEVIETMDNFNLRKSGMKK